MKFNKEVVLNIIGIFLIALSIVHLIQTIFFVDPVHFFWMCNHVILFIGIAILFRNSFWLMAEFLILFLGQFVWIINFFFKIFGNAFVVISYRIDVIPAIVHLVTLPLALVAILLLNKKEKFAWKGSLLHAVILMPFIFYFGSYYNLNCFFNPCVNWIPDISSYPIFIFLIYFAFIIALNYFLNWIIDKRIKKSKLKTSKKSKKKN
jgi:hypothetical protein